MGIPIQRKIFGASLVNIPICYGYERMPSGAKLSGLGGDHPCTLEAMEERAHGLPIPLPKLRQLLLGSENLATFHCDHPLRPLELGRVGLVRGRKQEIHPRLAGSETVAIPERVRPDLTVQVNPPGALRHFSPPVGCAIEMK